MPEFRGIPNNTAASWWRDPGMRSGMVRVIICYLAVYSLGYDGSLLNGLQALPAWQEDFGHPKGHRLGSIAAAYYLPKIPGAVIIAWCCDRFGRKPLVLAGAVFMIAGAVLGGLASTYAQFVGSRVILGVGTACSQIAATTLIPELSHPRVRHMSASFLNTMFYTGSIFAAWLTFAMVYYNGSDASWSWKIPNFIQGFGPVLLLSASIVPESPRWLIKHGKEHKAHAISARFHANGDSQDPLVLQQIVDIKAALDLEIIAKSSKWIDFVKTPGNRRRALIIISIALSTQLSGNGVVQYFLVPVLRQAGITLPAQTAGINGGLAVWNWFASMLGASLVERAGRRTLVLTSSAGMSACFIVITALSGGYAQTHHAALGISIVPFIFFFMAFYSVALTPSPYLYIPEISSLSMRAKSIALSITTTNICLAFNNFVNPIASAAIQWKYYFVYIGTLVTFGTIYYFFSRETRGLSIEEAAIVFDVDDPKAQSEEIKASQGVSLDPLDDEKEKGAVEETIEDTSRGSRV